MLTQRGRGRDKPTRLGSTALADVSFVAAFFLIPTFPEVIRTGSEGARGHLHGAATAGAQLASEVVDPKQVKQLRDTTVTTAPPTIAPTTTAPPPVPVAAVRPAAASRAPAGQAGQTCASVIATVESRGLFPAPGFVVICPGYAMGHAGMTCFNIASVCPGRAEIIIHDVQAYVVSNEFENSRIYSGAPARCHEIDCGHVAYGF